MTTIQNKSDKELLLRIKTNMILRGIFLTGFVIVVFIFQQQAEFPTPIVPLSIMIGVAYFLLMVYALFLKYCRNLFLVGSVQVTGDLFVVTGILFATGGIESPFSFLNILIIVATSTMLPRAACYLAASGAGILYGLLLDLEYFDILQPVYFIPKAAASYEGGYVFYIIFLNIASYYLVAYLSSVLSHRLKTIKDELAHKSIDLRKLQAFHKNVLQNMGNGLWTTDLTGRITSINPAAEEITGYFSGEAVGRFCFALLALPELKELFNTHHSLTLPLQIEGECRRKDGQTILILMKVSRLIEQGDQAKGFIGVFEDMTELREMEKKIAQSEKLAAVGKISAGLAHEIRNPLASLSGSIQVLQKGLQLKGTYERLMEIVLRETERLNTIVSDFLNYSHLGKTRSTLIDLTQVIQDLITLLKNSDEYHNSIRIDFKPQKDRFLFKGDEQQIKQMIWNLCINGLQAMAEGGTLTIRLHRVKNFARADYHYNREGLVLTVEDEGCGIPAEEENKIFEPFFTTKENGVGLGLAKVYQVVSQNDGFIGLDREAEKGARFQVFLPQTIALPDLETSTLAS